MRKSRSKRPGPRTPPGSRALDSTYRLAADSLIEIHEALESEAKALGLIIKFRGSAVRPAHILNAWALAILRLPEEVRERFTRVAVANLEAWCDLPVQPLGNYTPEEAKPQPHQPPLQKPPQTAPAIERVATDSAVFDTLHGRGDALGGDRQRVKKPKRRAVR